MLSAMVGRTMSRGNLKNLGTCYIHWQWATLKLRHFNFTFKLDKEENDKTSNTGQAKVINDDTEYLQEVTLDRTIKHNILITAKRQHKRIVYEDKQKSTSPQ
jgi:hypothetical protein